MHRRIPFKLLRWPFWRIHQIDYVDTFLLPSVHFPVLWWYVSESWKNLALFGRVLIAACPIAASIFWYFVLMSTPCLDSTSNLNGIDGRQLWAGWYSIPTYLFPRVLGRLFGGCKAQVGSAWNDPVFRPYTPKWRVYRVYLSISQTVLPFFTYHYVVWLWPSPVGYWWVHRHLLFVITTQKSSTKLSSSWPLLLLDALQVKGATPLVLIGR